MAQKILFSLLVISVIISSSTSSPFISSSLPECPAEADPNIIAYLPDPDNCGAFYECVSGNAYHYNCYPGLCYDEGTHLCDYEVNVDCGTRPITSTTTSSTPTNTTTSTTTNATTTTDITPPTKECPPEADPSVITFLPDPENCGAFYECVYGNAYHYNCYPGLYYNEHAQVCDYEVNVACGTRPHTTTSSTTNSTTSAPTSTPTNATTTTDITPATKECPPEADPTIVTFLPDSDNCGAFYECIYGHAYHYYCYPGLYYNEDAHVCDYQANVRCGTRPTTTTTTTVAPPIEDN